jgi:hypothetical protein
VTADLGHAVWKLDFDDDRPVLVLNRQIPDIHMIARGDDQFFSLVYPAVVQRILLQILHVEEYYDLDGDPDDWQCQWLRFVRQLPGISPPPKPEGDEDAEQQLWDHQMNWIDGVTAAFCERQAIRARFERANAARA